MFILQTPLVHTVKYKYMQTRPSWCGSCPPCGPVPSRAFPFQIPCWSQIKQLTVPWICCNISHFMLSQSFLFETIPSHPHPPNITTSSAWLLRFLFDSMHVSPLLKLSWNPQTTMTRICIYLCYCIKYTALQQLVHTLIQFDNNINFTVRYNTYELLIICQCFTGSILIRSPIRWLPLFLPNL